MRQRVVVKAHVSRHKPGKARGSLARHVSYLGRESASADGKHGVFYDAARDGVDAKQEAVQWAQDRHHFRLIVSPERGGDIPDMTSYIREVMRRVERDLDTKLQWIAVNHHNQTTRMRTFCCAGRRGGERTGPIWSFPDNIYRMESGTGPRTWRPNCSGSGARRKCRRPSPRTSKPSGSRRWIG
jgi:hypothetical protein